MCSARRNTEAGITLVEILVALALFAVIAGAGFTMLDQVLRTQERTEGRLERLADLQRTMHLLTLDLSEARGRSVAVAPGGVRLARSGLGAGEGNVTLTYGVEDGVLMRTVARASGPPIARQHLLDGVTGAVWRFHDARAGWLADWPPPGTLVVTGRGVPNPDAVELVLTLAEGGGVRRVALLPTEVQ